jgi:hypothetical protein
LRSVHGSGFIPVKGGNDGVDGPQTQVAGGGMTAVEHLTKRFGTFGSPVVAPSESDFSVGDGELVAGFRLGLGNC